MAEPGVETFRFSECRLVFTVDTSGSAAVRILDEERRFVQLLLDRLPAHTHGSVKIIGCSDRPVVVDTPDALVARGLSNPVLLLDDDECRTTLAKSDLWFFLTDGLLLSKEVKELCRKLRVHWELLHNTTCVVVIFGSRSTSSGPCDFGIPVEFSNIARWFGDLVIFNDAYTRNNYILEAKPAFDSLVGGRSCPDISGITQRDDWPILNLKDLVAMEIPRPARALEYHDCSENFQDTTCSEELSGDEEELPDDLQAVIIPQSPLSPSTIGYHAGRQMRLALQPLRSPRRTHSVENKQAQDEVSNESPSRIRRRDNPPTRQLRPRRGPREEEDDE